MISGNRPCFSGAFFLLFFFATLFEHVHDGRQHPVMPYSLRGLDELRAPRDFAVWLEGVCIFVRARFCRGSLAISASTEAGPQPRTSWPIFLPPVFLGNVAVETNHAPIGKRKGSAPFFYAQSRVGISSLSTSELLRRSPPLVPAGWFPPVFGIASRAGAQSVVELAAQADCAAGCTAD